MKINGDLFIKDSQTTLTKMVEKIDSIETDITDKRTYSESEKKTGEFWYNGKPIYRRIYYFSALSSGRVQLSTNIDTSKIYIIKLSGVARQKTNGQTFPLPLNRTDDAKYSLSTWVDTTGQLIVESGGQDRSDYEAWVIIEFWKAED